MSVVIGDEEEACEGELLAANGYTQVVTVCQAPVAEAKRNPGIRYVFIPLRDEPNFRMDFFMHRASAALSEGESGRTLLHCVAGISRSPSILIAHRLLTDPTAELRSELHQIAEMRPSANPNIGFFHQLVMLDSVPFELRLSRRVYFLILAYADQCGAFIRMR